MIANPPKTWRPDSWQARPAVQQPEYPDDGALRDALERLSHLPPLVTSFEVNALKQHLAEAQEGRRFVLQGGAVRVVRLLDRRAGLPGIRLPGLPPSDAVGGLGRVGDHGVAIVSRPP